jgi:hypothetical protein
MTFEKWWNETISYQYLEHVNLFHRDTAKQLAHDAWNVARSKWNYCKDGKKPKQNQRVNAIIKPEIKKNPLYVDTVVYRNGNYINERTCHFEEVIAWMPLPEAPNVHDD